MSAAKRKEMVLALYPYSRGVAFAAFWSPLSPHDWGVTEVRGKEKNGPSFGIACALIERLRPDVLVLGECRGSRRAARIGPLQNGILRHAEASLIETRVFTKGDVIECFKAVGASKRYDIAKAIASQIPAFEHRLPPTPKIWLSQNSRLGLFDAAALASTYFCQRK